MTPDLCKFPSTPHIGWLSNQPVRGDKILSPSEVHELLSNRVQIEEKIDGANLGISVGPDGKLRFQNRGNWLEGKLTGQWTRLRGWAAAREIRLREHLPENHVLFGEWCYAKHSIEYDHLPDWFLAFDVYDCFSGRFWSSARRDGLLRQMEISPVPSIACGRYTLFQLGQMLENSSAYGSSSREGIYLRREHGDWLVSRAKLIRPEFVQQISEHWSKGPIHSNRLAGAV